MQVTYFSKVMRVGTSLAIVLPVPILTALELERGDRVVFAVYDGGILTARKLSAEEIRNMKPLEIIKS